MHLQLLQSILVPTLHFHCEIWGMHCPDAGPAKQARLNLQRLYEIYLWVICGLCSSNPHNMLLTDLGLLLLQVIWWRQTLRFSNSIATLPIGSFYHCVLLDRCYDAFHVGAFNFSSSVAACLHQVGVSMPHDIHRVPALNVPVVIDALRVDVQGLDAVALCCPRQAPSFDVVRYTYTRWLQPVSTRRRYCQLPISGKRMRPF